MYTGLTVISWFFVIVVFLGFYRIKLIEEKLKDENLDKFLRLDYESYLMGYWNANIVGKIQFVIEDGIFALKNLF